MAFLPEESTLSLTRGMNDSVAATGFRQDEAAVLTNYRITPDGKARVRNGSKRTHSTALNSGAQGYGAIEFQPTTGNRQRVAFVGDSVYYSTDEGLTWSLIASGLRTDYWSLVTMTVGGTNYLYCANGSTAIYRWDGAAWTTVTGPATGCTLLAVHNERLWTTDGITVYASKVADPSVWALPDGLSLPVLTHDGDADVTGLYSLGPVLLVWKRRSMGYIDGYGNSDVIVAAGSRGISREIGCIAPFSIAGFGSGVIWLSERGFVYYTVGTEPVIVSESVDSFLEDINWSAIEATRGLPHAITYPLWGTYECILPAAVSQNDYTFVYRVTSVDRPGAATLHRNAPVSGGQAVSVSADGYLQLGGTQQVRTHDGYLSITTGSQSGQNVTLTGDYLALSVAQSDAAVLFTAGRDTETSRPAAVGYDGFVRNLDSGALDDVLSDGTGGSAIPDRLLTRPYLFQDPFRKKRGRVIRVQAVATTSDIVTARLVADGTNGTAHSVSIAASAGGEPKEAKARVTGKGHQLQVEITNVAAGTEITGIALRAEPLPERP